MADVTSLIPEDTEQDGDGVLLTELANALAERQKTLCTLKTFYDGREEIPVRSIPASTNKSGYAVYQRFVRICQMDLAKAIADAVIYRQRPTGFRLVSDKTMRSTDADEMWAESRMDLKSRQMFHDLAVYGNAYALVNKNKYPSHITVLSPWTTYVSSDEDAAVFYHYDAVNRQDVLTLYRLTRNDDGSVNDVYVRSAVSDSDRRSLLVEGDDELIYSQANYASSVAVSFSPTFKWEGGPESDFDFAKACQCLPVVRIHAPGGKGQFEAHIPALSSIDQQRFQRFCIQELQAFKQRAVSMNSMPQYYKESDPQVRDGLKQAGDKIDYKEMFEQGPDALWLVPGDAKFWESGTTDINPLITAVSADVKHLAAASGTPLDILSPDVAGSAEGASLKREGLVFKVEDLNARANDGFTRMMRMSLYADGNTNAADERFETVWKAVNPPSMLEQAQAASYSKNILPVKTNWRRNYGMTEIEIAEAMQDLMDTQFAQALAVENALVDGKLTEQSPGLIPDETASVDGMNADGMSLDDGGLV